MIKWKNEIIAKERLVNQATVLSRFVINLQLERAMICLAVFLDARSGKATNLDKAYGRTDQALQTVKWRKFGTERIFENKLRFQIRLDDFRYYALEHHKFIQEIDIYTYSLISFRERVTMLTTMAANSTRRVTDAEVLEFYNLATSKILTGLEVYVSCKHDIKIINCSMYVVKYNFEIINRKIYQKPKVARISNY